MPNNEVLYTISPSTDSTVAVEVRKTGLLRRRKYLISFETFQGHVSYVAEHVQSSRMELCVDSGSLICRDPSLKPRKQRALSRYARDQILSAARDPEIRFDSRQISAKQTRGFAIEGVLDIGNVTRTVKVNIVITAMKNGTLQIEGDATVRLSDFRLKPPKTLFGLVGTKDEVLIRLLLWATRASPQHASSAVAQMSSRETK